MDVKVLEIADWETPASKYQVAQKGNYRIGHHVYQPGFYAYHGMDGYSIFSVKKPIRATTLMELSTNRFGTLRWREWMVDSPTDYRAMQKYAEMAHGKVLTTGLGLGLVTHELCKNDRVESITIVEVSPTVIELIKGYLPDDPRIEILCSDFWKFTEQDDSRWDCMIVDIWVYYGLEQQMEMYRNEIIPANQKLKVKYPDTRIIFHGFAGMPTVEKLDSVIADDDGTNPLVIDPLIYGLQESSIIPKLVSLVR